MRLSRLSSSLRSMRHAGARLCILGLSAMLAACGGGGGGGNGFALLPPSSGTATPPAGGSEPDEPITPPGTPVVPVASCASLAGMAIGAGQIGLPTQGAVVTSANAIAAADAGNVSGDYCQLRGTIQPVDPQAPAITFAVNLPDAWNRKVIHFGGGGFDGVLIDGTEPVRFGPADKPTPLALGYATFGDDAGHQSSSITDGKFAANDEALANYGGQSLKKTHDVALLLVKARYGTAPAKAYFLGTSTGGRDALLHIQRWPNDYDGVIANEPALNYTGTRLSNVAVGRALYANGGVGWVNLAKTLLVQKTVLAACDRLDGATDGIVSNVESCRQLNAQVLASLRCAGGTDNGDTCLSDPQLASIRAIESPLVFTHYTLANGVTRAGGYNLLEGALVAGPFTSRDLGTRAVPGNPASTADANMYVTGDQWAKYFVTRNASFDTLTLDPLDPGAYTARVAAVSAITDATNADLSPFLAHGGRLIMMQGLADEVISNNSTIDYYGRLIATLGQAAVDQGIRFYTVPGMGHGTGVFIPAWDSLAALENWVEHGLAPATGVVADSVAGTYGRTRPLCQFPAWPKFKGSGSMDAAVNYSCVQEVGDPLACPNLPASATTYKGGDLFGEELSLAVDPTTLHYTVTIDASLQRAAGTQRNGTLVSNGNCNYTSGENGAGFTFGAGGAVQGGVAAPTGASFVPLIAFQNTFQNAATPAVFNPVANIFNVVGVQYGSAGAASAYTASSRVRNAGTFQSCQAPVSGGFITYDANCTSTTKGYLTYNSARNAFDMLATSPTGGAVTTGGTPSGSAIFGQVGAVTVPIFLVRESATSYGMRLYAPQTTLSPGTADGHFVTADNNGGASEATVSGSSFNLGGASGTLAYDNPVLGVVQSTGTSAGNLIYNAGLLGFVPASGTGAVLQLGVRN
ncbi:tannase/feruloyl esterase family alpha/beta hydrolase [Variovorax sp. PBL-E5]|uniref:tannase/feruloyl esterase family alpha/beta hydrolase n=1 Tax=Variovorax sp. PBL-E5 TaxID=434014 RepID=UPI00131670FE|nr:tannase/feruloyl esterase family alpha/beta hydrolase [Variovorax sp. PBL-E5]VTU33154.1 Tannase and feruloyl esterase [Variovorax sp. PBL-E5]